jgi:thioredoxin 1
MRGASSSPGLPGQTQPPDTPPFRRSTPHQGTFRQAGIIGLRDGRGRPDCPDAGTTTSRSALTTPQEESMSDLIKHVTDDTFEPEVLKSDLPVLVDYWAEWCGPCKAIAPVLEEVAKEYSGKLRIAKVDVDSNTEVPKKFNIRGIPTLMLFKNGAVEATKVGAMSKSQLTAFLDSNI